MNSENRFDLILQIHKFDSYENLYFIHLHKPVYWSH
jgi:hypothetical protein